MELSRYWKGIIATLAALAITVVQVVLSQQADGAWTREDTIVTVLAFLNAVLVVAKANTTTDPAVARKESVVYTGKHVLADDAASERLDRGSADTRTLAVLALVIAVVLAAIVLL